MGSPGTQGEHTTQPRHAPHAGAQVRVLPRHLARQDQARRAGAGPVLPDLRSSSLRGPPALVPPGGGPRFPGHNILLLILPLLGRTTQKLGVNWLMAEFWFTAGSPFLYFTAFVAMLAHFSEMEGGEYQYWVDACIAAGVFGLLNDVFYGLGAYLIYVEWKANPTGAAAPAPGV